MSSPPFSSRSPFVTDHPLRTSTRGGTPSPRQPMRTAFALPCQPRCRTEDIPVSCAVNAAMASPLERDPEVTKGTSNLLQLRSYRSFESFHLHPEGADVGTHHGRVGVDVSANAAEGC